MGPGERSARVLWNKIKYSRVVAFYFFCPLEVAEMKDADPFPWMETPPRHLPLAAETPGFLGLTSKFRFQDVPPSVPKKFHGTNGNF